MSDKPSKEVDHGKLRFIRIFTPMHIPKELIEQVRDREYSVDDWYKYQEVICLRQTNEGPQLNPLSLLYVIADEGNKVVGMLWCEIDALSKALIIQIFSMDRAYWGRGKAVELLSNKVKEIIKECKLNRVVWQTNYPRHSERYGFKRSKTIQMEYHQEAEDGQGDGEHKAYRGCSDGNTGTDGISEPSIAGPGSTSTERIPAVLATV